MDSTISGRRGTVNYRLLFVISAVIAMILLASTVYLAVRPPTVAPQRGASTTTSSGVLVPELPSVTVAVTVNTYENTGALEIGSAQGFFKSLGLNVSWVATTNALQALQGGQVQFALAPPPFTADAAGGTLVAVGQQLPNFPAAIIAAPGITSLSQLNGKTFGCTTSGSVTCMMPYMLMQSQNWTTSISLIKPIGGQSALIAALEGGDIQAMVWDWGVALQLQQSGKANILGDIRTYVPDWPTGCVLVNRDFLTSDPNTVRLFLAGLYDTNAWIEQNPGPTQLWIQNHYGLDADQAGVLYNTTQFSLIGTMQPGVLKLEYQETATAYGLPPVDLNDTFTNDFLPSISFVPSA